MPHTLEHSIPIMRQRLPLSLFTLLVITLLAACSKPAAIPLPDPAFGQYVAAFTAGHISARAPIKVQLTAGIQLNDTSQQALQQLFTLKPSTPGTVSWEDAHTLVFQPAERLAQHTDYQVTFHLQQIAEVPDAFKQLTFGITTLQQDLELELKDVFPASPDDLSRQRVMVTIYTHDDATGQDLASAVTASQQGRQLALTWEHEPGGTLHHAVADNVERGEHPRTLTFNWDARKIGGQGTGEFTVNIPALGDFSLLQAKPHDQGEQSIALLFSDPLNPGQDLSGLATIKGQEDVRLAINGNKLILYPTEPLSGDQTVFVAAGLQNGGGHSLGEPVTATLYFEQIKPDIRNVGTGTILPSTDGLLLPFEAVNLNAVDVRVVRIYRDNIPQFLQENQLGGDNSLVNTARLMLRKTIPLEPPKVQGQWERYHLDLNELVKTEPGAIYRIILGFKQAYSTYPCEGHIPQQPLARTEPQELDDSNWDNPYSYYYDGMDDPYEGPYNWRDRDDPCTPSYYRSKGSATARNILASDMGLIAKRGNDGSWLIAATDLLTTKPMAEVDLNVLDLQQQVVATVRTGSNGIATLPSTPRKPFLVSAVKGHQHAYLRVDDGNSNSVSKFDVEGTSVHKGIKGYIYAERGVWRPGDPIFLTFILQDSGHDLPTDIPVTLELTDPRGRLDQRMVRTTHVDGTYAFHCGTKPDDPTGIWNVRISVGGTTFHKALRVETVKPNRLKVLLDPGADSLTYRDNPVATLQGSWLHGAPAKHLKARVSITMTRATARFKKAKDFIFDDLNTDLNTDEINIFDGTLDADGKASFPLKPKVNPRSPAAVKVNLLTRLFEAGGDASMDRLDLTYYPYSSYAGLKLPQPDNPWGGYHTDTTYQVQAIALDDRGQPRPNRKLIAQVVKTKNNWWWSSDMDEPGNYMTAPSTRVIDQYTLETDRNGKATFPFRVEQPQWGTFIVRIQDPESNHAAAAELYVDWPGYSGRSRRGAESNLAMLTFNSDKESYQVGESCTLTIPGPPSGRALVSIENASHVIKAEWIAIESQETKYTFKVEPGMDPNVYAHVTVLQPHAATASQTDNDRPIRMYGVIPIHVENPGTHLNPLINTQAEFKTDRPFTVEVAEQDGKPMSYTLAIVDEGLLDLTRFTTPDPWAHFNAKEALGVRTWDVYDEVIGAHGRVLNRVLALGGSDQLDPVQAAKAQRFQPVVHFVGPLKLEKGKRAKHTFTITNYVGSVRVMLVANTPDAAYGNAEKTVPVRKPLMLLATLPRVAAPGETMELPVTVFAMDAKVEQVALKLVTNDLFEVIDQGTKHLTFKKTGEQVATFSVRAKERIGVGKVTLTASGAGETATQAIELDIRQTTQPETRITEAIIEPGQTWQAVPEAFGVAGTNSAYVELSTLPPVDMNRRLAYLIDYPHMCMEQNISRALPQLVMPEVMELNEATTNEMRQNVLATLNGMKRFQTTSGGFANWPGNNTPDPWTSTYAGHLMVEAERKGFTPPPGVKAAWMAHARQQTREWTVNQNSGWTRESSQLEQAYRLYVLALNNTADAGAMNRLRTTPHLGARARWMLAAAYAINNRKDVAQELIEHVATTTAPYNEMAWTYGSELRDRAVMVEALLRIGDQAKATTIAMQMAKDLSRDQWYSTQSTAWALLAISRFAKQASLQRTMRYTTRIDGNSENRLTEVPLARLDLPTPNGQRTVAIKNNGENIIHLRMVSTGRPVAGQETPGHNDLLMQVEYQTMGRQTLNPAMIEQGTDFQAVVTVHNPGNRGAYRDLALSQVFPSGWEIRNTRLEGTEETLYDSPFTYQDIRDDRVNTYFNLAPGGSATFRVRLNAAYTGRYHLPSTVCSAMYDQTVFARNAGQWVRVVKPGETSGTASRE